MSAIWFIMANTNSLLTSKVLFNIEGCLKKRYWAKYTVVAQRCWSLRNEK